MAARPLTMVSEEDGALIERHAGTEKHSWMQAALAAYVFRRRKAWGVTVYTEPGCGRKIQTAGPLHRAWASPRHPDLRGTAADRHEILSPEDRPLRVDQTIAEWLEFGVEYVWVVDPETLESILTLRVGGYRFPMRRCGFPRRRSKSHSGNSKKINPAARSSLLTHRTKCDLV